MNKYILKYRNNEIQYPSWLATMNISAPSEVTDKLSKFIKKSELEYIDIDHINYYESICNHFKKEFNASINPNGIINIPTTMYGVNKIIKFVTEGYHKNSIAVFSPIFPEYKLNKRVSFCESKLIPNLEKNRYEIDWDNLKKIICKNKISAILLCNPHNPTGKVFSLDELTKIIQIAKKYNIWVISDEVFSDFSSLKFYPLISTFDYKKIVSLYSPSKTYNITGIRSSYLISYNKQLNEFMRDEISNDGLESPNIISVVSTILGYKYGSKWKGEVKTIIDENVNLIKNMFPDSISPEGGIYFWVNALSNIADMKSDLKRNGIKVSLGKKYGKEYTNNFRMNTVDSTRNIEYIMKHIKEIDDVIDTF